MTFKENVKTAIAKVFSDLIQSDGIVNQGEIRYLHEAFTKLRIDNSHLKKSVGMTLAEAVTVLKGCGPAEKQAIRQHIERLSGADGDVDPNETLLIAALTLSIGAAVPEAPTLKADLISLPGLSFDTRDTVIYVESAVDRKTNRAIVAEYEALCQLCERRDMKFFYLPAFMKSLKGNIRTLKQTLRYLEPLLSDEQMRLIVSDMKHIDTPMLSKEIFLNYLNSRGFHLEQPAFLFKIENKKASHCQDFLLLHVDRTSPLATLKEFFDFNDRLLELPEAEPVEDQLEYTGLHKIVIDTILKYHTADGLSRLLIDEDGRLFLLDRNRTEVKMQALARALYILYLRHEEGIALTELCDHRQELLEIYSQVSSYSDSYRLQKAINNLTDVTGNTLNPLLTRIRKSFIALLGKQAKDYLIEGAVSDVKRINLPRNLVIDKFSAPKTELF